MRIVIVDLNDRGGVITVEAATQEEALSGAARSLVLKQAAANGISRPGLSGNESAFPVDAEGNTTQELLTGAVPVAAYRCDYNVAGGL